MFEFMHKYRVAILAVVFIGLVGLGAWGAIQGLFASDGNRDVGSFKVPGQDERVVVDWNTLRAAMLTLKSYGRDMSRLLADRDLEQRAWCFLCLKEMAEAAGIRVSTKRIKDLLSTGQDGSKQFVSDDLVAWYRDATAVSQAAALVLSDPNAGGVTYPDLLERFKSASVRKKIRYAVFEKKKPEDFAVDLKQEDDRKKLEEFAKLHVEIGERNALPERVDVEAVWVRFRPVPGEEKDFDFDKRFEENWKALAADVEIAEEAVLARYQDQKIAYDRLSAELKKPATQPTGDQPSKFEVVKPRIIKELKVHALMKRFFEEASKLDAEALKKDEALAGLAKKYHFKTGVRRRVDRVGFQKIPEFGNFQYLPKLFAAALDDKQLGKVMDPVNNPAARLLEGVCDTPTTCMSLLRPFKYRAKHPASLDDKPEVYVEAWQKEQAEKDLEARAQALIDRTSEIVDGKLAAKRKELEAAAEQKIAKEIEELGLDPKAEENKERVADIRTRIMGEVDGELEPLRAEHEAAAWEAALAELKLKAVDSPWLDMAQQMVPQFTDDPLPEEKIRRVLRDSRLLGKLKPTDTGRLADVYVDQAAGLAMVALVKEKHEPGVTDLYMAESGDVVQRLKRELAGRAAPAPLTYERLKDPAWFDILAPELEAQIQREKETAKRQAEDRRKADLRRARRAANRARRSRTPGKDQGGTKPPAKQEPGTDPVKKPAGSRPAQKQG